MNLLYKNHEDIVSIDEKWFRSDPLRKTLKYLPDHARHPNNTGQHKSHSPQLMITAAISELSMEKSGLSIMVTKWASREKFSTTTKRNFGDQSEEC